MLKGAQKRMIVVKTGNSRLFEEAYFVVRGDALSSGGDMVCEANKIIESCGESKREVSKPRVSMLPVAICSFIGGGALGSIITLLVVFL